MENGKLRVGIIGAGNIAARYAADIQTYPQLELRGVTDILPERAAALAAESNSRAYASTEEMLADPEIDLVVNLTIHHAHKAITTQCLEAGKHVYTEKPIALTYRDAKRLVELAKKRGLRLGSSPMTFMGEAQQTAWKVIREGRLGTIRVAYAEVNWGRIESWHPAPQPFYDVGVLFDVAVYPLTVLTAFLGPARRVWANGRVLYPDRVTKDGVPFHIETPDFVVAMIELENGTLVRLTADFYVSGKNTRQAPAIEFHGDDGSLFLSTFDRFDSRVEFSQFGKELEAVPLVRPGYHGIAWGRGAAEMADAIVEGRPHRATGEQAAHIVEIIAAAHKSIKTGRAVRLNSDFPPPAPMDWAM